MDRQALTAWGGVPTAALGEHFWLMPQEVPAHPLVRFAMPASLTLPLDCDPSVELARFAVDHGVGGIAAVAIRRHGQFAAARIQAWAAAVGLRDAGPAINLELYRTPLLQVLCGDKHIFVCCRSAQACHSPFAGGVFKESKAGLSRAGAKFLEARAYLAATRNLELRGSHWLELGAFPGGMTAALAAEGAQVTAVDLRARPASLAGFAGVAWHAQNVETFVAQDGLDGLLCDLNGPYRAAALTVTRLAPALRSQGAFIHVLKLSRWSDFPEALAAVTVLFAAASLEIEHVRHFCANRQEVTLLGRKR